LQRMLPANCKSPQPGHVQSPALSAHPVCNGAEPPSKTGLRETFCCLSPSLISSGCLDSLYPPSSLGCLDSPYLPISLGCLGSPYLASSLGCLDSPYLRSLESPCLQSPLACLGSLPLRSLPDDFSSGLSSPQNRQIILLANWSSPQAGQFHSPGIISCPPLPNSFVSTLLRTVSCGLLSPPAGLSLSLLAPSAGFGSPHRRHEVFLAKFISPQAGQCQSPGIIC